MKKKTYEYRIWKKHQNEKNLRRRSRRKKRIKSRHFQKYCTNKIAKEDSEYDAKAKVFTIKAPSVFSIVENPAETIHFFNQIISFMTRKENLIRELFVDIRDVEELRTDALMYLLAVMNNHNRKYGETVRFSGNEPTDQNVRKKFKESGFYSYVRPRKNPVLAKSTDKIQIVCGEKCDTETAKKVSDFVCAISKVSTRKCSFLYNTMIELMSNAHKHAYNDNGVLMPIWYCFVEYDKHDMISFIFMDTGSGIPSTVQKNFAEKVDILRLKEENRYVISALDGEFRTATRQDYRGKGLPKIREYCTDENIRDLHIVSNKADVEVCRLGYYGNDLIEALQGTLYCWNIDLNILRGL